MNVETPVVVLKCRPYAQHPGTIGIVRSLGRLGVAVHACVESPTAPVGYSRYCRETLPVQDVAADPSASVDRLLGMAFARPPVLVPVDDVAAVFVNDHSDRLSAGFLLPEQPAGLARALADKWTMRDLADRAGVPSARTMLIRGAGDADAAVAALGLPVVVKARAPDALARAPRAASVRIAATVAEVADAVAALDEGGPGNALLQEFIPGTPQSIVMVNGYFDERSRPLFLATGRKLRQRPAYTGPTSLGVCDDVPEVRETTARLMSAIGYSGPLDAGFRYDERDGLHKLLDVNPRIGATFRLFTAGDGMDVVRAHYLHLTGQQVTPSRVSDGRRWLVEHSDLAAAPTYLRHREETVSGYLRSLRADETAWWAGDDRRPFLAMLALSGRSALRKWAAGAD